MAYSFENLEVWKSARLLVSNVYQLISLLPSFEKSALCLQIRRAVISVPSNIAEGSSRISAKEQLHFIEISYGSLMEVYCQLILSFDLGYIDNEQLENVKNLIYSISKMLNGLRYHKLKQLNPKSSHLS